MTAPLNPTWRATVYLDNGVILRWSTRPLSDPGAWTDYTLISISNIKRAATDQDNNYRSAECDIVLNDARGDIRALVADPFTRAWRGLECHIEMLSETGRYAELDWRMMFRGVVTQRPVMLSNRKAKIHLTDLFGSKFSTANLEKVVGQKVYDYLGSNFDFPEASKTLIFPQWIGSQSDRQDGVVDANGDPADIGMCDPVDAGFVRMGTGTHMVGVGTLHSQTGATGTVTSQIHSYIAVVRDGVIGPLSSEGGNLNRGDFGDPHGQRINWGQAPGSLPTDNYIIWVFWSAGVDTNDAVFFNPLTGEGLNGGTVRVFTHDNVTFDGFGVLPDEDFYIELNSPSSGISYSIPPAPEVDPPRSMVAPTDGTGEVIGVGGDETYFYAFQLVSQWGISRLGSTIAVQGAPIYSELAFNNYVQLQAEIPSDYDDSELHLLTARIWGRTNGTPTNLLGDAYIVGRTIYFNDGASPAPVPNTTRVLPERAIAPPTTDGPFDPDLWLELVFADGAIQSFLDIYGANNNQAEGVAPKRVRLTPDRFGTECLCPGRDGWPYDTDYLEKNGKRYMAIYVRGDLAKHHRDGSVTVAANLCGYEANGDCTGLMVDDAGPAFQLWLTQFVLANGGTGNLAGWIDEIPTFRPRGSQLEADPIVGDPMLQTSTIDAYQAMTVQRVGGTGYKANWGNYGTGKTLSQCIKEWCDTHDFRFATNHWGQGMFVFLDDLADRTEGIPYRYPQELRGPLPDEDPVDSEQETKITFAFWWSASRGAFLKNGFEVTAEGASRQYKAVLERPLRQLYATADTVTAMDSQARRLRRNQDVPCYQDVPARAVAIENDLGTPFRLTHWDGPGRNGYFETPFVVLAAEYRNIMRPNFGVTLTGLNMDLILATGDVEPTLGDEGTNTELLGDESTPGQPQLGA